MKPILETIDTRYGTDNSHSISHGNTLPYTGAPFGMNYFVPQSSHTDGSWFFNPDSPIFQGIRLTHQPSPWIGDYSWLLITPVSEKIQHSDIYHRQSSYRPDESIFQPHYLKINSNRYQISTELTPSRYGARFRMTNQREQPISLILHSEANATFRQVDAYTLFGSLREETQPAKQPLVMHVCLRFDQPIKKQSFLDQDLVLDFEQGQLQFSLATSFISEKQALINLPQSSFDELKEETKQDWEAFLHRFDIVDQGKIDRRMFDQALYRLFLFPQTFYELDAEGQEIHWDFTHQTVQPGKLFTNIGFWDGFRTSFPLLALMAPDTYHNFLEGFLNFYKETGFLPKWLAPDERGMMPGTLIDGVIADAAAKNLIPDLEKDLFQAMLETAEKDDPSKRYGRQGASDYQTLGYLPFDYQESVSHSLDYSYSDFCIASLANKLQQKSVAQRYSQQSLNYQHLFDPETGYMRAKDRKGQFRPDFSPYTWGRDYAECSAIQNTLSIFHDIEGLKNLMGGQTAFTDYLTKLCQDQPFFDVTGYGYEIHEMSEMATAHFGQLAISNQPSFHIPYLFRYSDKPEYTSLLIKSLREQGFRPGWQAFPGDEDNGSLSAWYIWSAIGLYPTCPGKPFYNLGIPLFNHLRLYLPQSQTWLDIYAHDNYPHFQFVTKTELDGQALQHISHEELLVAKRLDFHLSWLPNSSKE